jgi:deazaflavin-dependent oxidoreductase (nitroreductase family)
MPNPFSKQKWFHRMGTLMLTPTWKVAPTPKGLALVTTTGRKSGKPRQRAMRAVVDGDRAYAAAILGDRADWVRNVRANPDVTIKLGGKTRRANARALTDPQERARAADIYRPIAGWYDYFDYATFVWGLPTRGNVLRVHDEWFETGTPVVFELHPEG